MTTLTPTRDTQDTDRDTDADRPWNVIVLNDDHNTFQGVAFALSSTIPGVSYEKGLKLADAIDATGRAVVWSGNKEPAELYWDQLRGYGLTMGPLESS
jgi:ATP-dependent Clp protease adaptor protein ClpS